MNLLDRYIARTLLRSFAVAQAALVTVFSVITLTEELRTVDGQGYDIVAALVYVLLNIPSEAYGLFPASALLAAVLALGQMMQHNELVAMQAAGISRGRITAATLVTAGAIGVGGILFAEWVAAPLSAVAHSRRALAMSGGRMLNTRAGLWFRDGHQVVHAAELRPDGSLGTITVLEIDAQRVLQRVVRARSAARRADSWALVDAQESWLDGDMLRTTTRAELPWDTTLAPRRLRTLWLDPEELSLSELAQAVTTLRRQKQSPLPFEIAWLRRASSPFYIAAMVGLALSLLLGAGHGSRLGARLAERLVLGTMAGLGFHLFQQMFTNFGLTAGLPAAVTALAPAVFVLGTSTALLRLGVRR